MVRQGDIRAGGIHLQMEGGQKVRGKWSSLVTINGQDVVRTRGRQTDMVMKLCQKLGSKKSKTPLHLTEPVNLIAQTRSNGGQILKAASEVNFYHNTVPKLHSYPVPK